ncbi:PKD domain-containing protein [Kitasatospora sp. NPDC002227]|uniref:PKD domain-containing protein n=1 Tax=Kitasatospora sp. NPDC002227 TaxID=3154773 RepID=UPI0033274F3C
MSSLRRSRRLAAAIVVASTGLVSAGVTLPAVAADADTLYVDNSAANCADGGAGSQEQPFCTIQAGVDAAKPGQTVQVAFGKDGCYAEQVDVHRSGEPGRPIVVAGRPGQPKPLICVFPSGLRPDLARGFVLDHVHDVTVRGVEVDDTPAEAFLVKDSSAVTVEGNEIGSAGSGSGWTAGGKPPVIPAGAPAVRVTGASSGVTVSRNILKLSAEDGIAVEAGVTGAVITTNALMYNQPRGIRVTDAPGTVVTSNSVVTTGGSGITLEGKSDHAVVENNVLAHERWINQNLPQIAELSVSADSVAGTKADYNSLYSYTNSLYSWAGTDYQRLADFAKASGQGAHDVQEAPAFGLDGYNSGTVRPTAASGSTDSADTAAPGELTTDLYGKPRVDDPQAVNSGTGAGYYDRGAVELQAFASFWVQTSLKQGPFPLPVTVTATAKQNWPDTTTYTYDFGDGSDQLTTADAKVQHVYQAKGSYTVKVTAKGTGENMSTTAIALQPVTVNEPGDLTPDLAVSASGDGPLGFSFDLTHSTSPWLVTGYQLDYGDGSPKESHDQYHPTSTHVYQRPGDYSVTATLTDEGGRTATVKQVVHAVYGKLGFIPITPTRVFDSRKPDMGGRPQRLAPGQSVTLYVPTQAGHPHADAAVLNVTAVNPDSAGYLSVYPYGTDRPATSNVNFKAGQTVPNLVTVPTGQNNWITLYNFSGGTDVVVDVMGYYEKDGGSRFGAVAPSRLLDTRKSAAVGPDSSTSIQVRGTAGVPNDATAVVLNLTATASDAGSYLTAYASGTGRPGTSNLNFTAGQTVANQVVVPIGDDGKVSVYNRFGHTHVVADVFGYYGPSGALFTPVVPTRLVDTRKQTAVGTGKFLKVDTGVPAGATGAVLNVTSTASTAGGYLTVWADGAPKPGTSNVNFPAGATVPNHVTTPLGTNGAFDVYNFAGSTQVVADLFGYFSK